MFFNARKYTLDFLKGYILFKKINFNQVEMVGFFFDVDDLIFSSEKLSLTKKIIIRVN